MNKLLKFRSLIEILLLGMAWGPSYLFVKIGLVELSPFSIAAGRVSIGAILLYVLLKIKRHRLPPLGKGWIHFVVMGFFANSLPFILFGIGELRVSSAMAGIINGLTPLVTAVLAHFFLSGERLNLTRLTGVFLGASGFALILIPSLLGSSHNGGWMDMLCLAGAAVSYSIGMIYGRKYLGKLPPFVAPTAQLLVSALYLVPLAFLTESFYNNEPLTWTGVGVVAGLGVLGTALAFIFYYRVLEHSGAAYLSMATYLLPIFASVLGAVVLDEKLRWTSYLAGGIILLGMMVMNGTIRIPGLSRERQVAKVVERKRLDDTDDD